MVDSAVEDSVVNDEALTDDAESGVEQASEKPSTQTRFEAEARAASDEPNLPPATPPAPPTPRSQPSAQPQAKPPTPAPPRTPSQPPPQASPRQPTPVVIKPNTEPLAPAIRDTPRAIPPASAPASKPQYRHTAEPAREAPGAARPGAWANTSALVNQPNRTQIASQLVGDSPPAGGAFADPSRVGGPTLIVQTGDLAGSGIPLAGKQTEWTIGSDSSRHAVIAQNGISANHAVIVREGSKWKVCDQMSVNGTFVNGNRTNISYINSGDIIRFGPVECVFAVPGGRASKPGKNTKKGPALWMIVAGLAILLLLGGAWYAFSSGLLTNPAPTAVTEPQ